MKKPMELADQLIREHADRWFAEHKLPDRFWEMPVQSNPCDWSGFNSIPEGFRADVLKRLNAISERSAAEFDIKNMAEHITDTLAAGSASVRSARRVRAVTIRCETRIGHVTAEVVIDPVPGVGVSVLSVVTDDGDAWSLPEVPVQVDATRDVVRFVERMRSGVILGADACEWPTPIPCDGTNGDSLDADFMDQAQEDR